MQNNETFQYLLKESLILKEKKRSEMFKVFFQTFALMFVGVFIIFNLIFYQERSIAYEKVLGILLIFSMIMGLIVVSGGEYKTRVLRKHNYEKEMINLYDFLNVVERRKYKKEKRTEDEILSVINKNYEKQKLSYLNEALRKSDTYEDYEMKREILEKEFKNKSVSVETKNVMVDFK